MNKLLKEHKKYQDAIPTDKQFDKLKGELKAGATIKIKWKGRRPLDEGYLFALPISQYDEDLLFHVPSPDNSDGIDDAPPVWGHINNLLMNDEVTEIRCVGGF